MNAYEKHKAAELQAKLAMVEERHKPSHGRHPKKIGMLTCSTGVKNGYSEERTQFVLRLDADKGEFIAEHGDVWYVSKSRDALKAKMDQVAKVTLDIEWTRYLEVEYEATTQSRDHWSYGTTSLGIDDKREKDTIIFGIELTWKVIEYSSAFQLPGDDRDRIMMRKVDDHGKAEESQEVVREMPVGLVPYTKEREALLQRMRKALTTIDAKMVELLTGTPDEVAKRLDAAGGPLLLAAPPDEKPSKKR